MRIKVTAATMFIMLAMALPIWSQSHVPDLSLGDPAPDLDIAIIKGEPIDIDSGKGKNVYMVEFWATWCPSCRASISHLTELQKRYADSGLVVVGISIEEPDEVTAFVKEAGAKMEYTVAVDRGERTTYNYMAPFNEYSIPHAFVIDKSGILVWHGHPSDPTMEKVIVSLVNEKIDERPKS